uniref:Uncharacterized protein n=1 Tax=Rhizophora mucronata TaxID=61149 RepID=A0A2P2Q8Z9_RHIMU
MNDRKQYGHTKRINYSSFCKFQGNKLFKHHLMNLKPTTFKVLTKEE